MYRKTLFLISGLILGLISGGAMAFTLTSSAFSEGAAIPAQYTCQGQNISPPLSWQDAPANTQSFVLIVDDPDAPAGIWDHWVVFNIPATIHEINDVAVGTVGKNSWGHNRYDGPCPPSGTHRYFFKLYALDTKLELSENSNKATIESAMQNHILAQTELMATYQK